MDEFKFLNDISKQADDWIICYYSWIDNPDKDEMESHRFAYECGARQAFQNLSSKIQEIVQKGDAWYNNCICQDPENKKMREDMLRAEGKDPEVYSKFCDSFGCRSIKELIKPLKEIFKL